MKHFLKLWTVIGLSLMIGITHPLRDVTYQQLDNLKKQLTATTKIIKDLDAGITKAKNAGQETSTVNVTIDKKKYDLTAQSLLGLRNDLAKILKDIATIDPVQQKSLEQGVQEDLKAINGWTSEGLIATTAVVIGEDRGPNKFKTIEYKADGISDNRNTLLQIKDWFTSKIGTVQYTNAIDTASGMLDGQLKILEKMLNGINITYPGTNNTTDKLAIVTADQLEKVFETINSAIEELGKLKTADDKPVSEIDAIKKQIEQVKTKRIAYLQDIILKIANDSAKTQALGTYLKEKRLDYWLAESILHSSVGKINTLSTLGTEINGSLLNVAKEKQLVGDHMPHYIMLNQECSYFADTINVLANIVTVFEDYFKTNKAVFNNDSIKKAVVDKLYTNVHWALLAQAINYTSRLGSVDDNLSSSKLNNKDTGVEDLNNRAFYNKYIANPFKKSIAETFKQWNTIQNGLLTPLGIKIDKLSENMKEAEDSIKVDFEGK